MINNGELIIHAFISVLNPEVVSVCSFCSNRKTIFHADVDCKLYLVVSMF